MAAAEEESHTMKFHPRLYEDKSYRHGFLGTVGDFQKAGVLQDVVLEVEGRRFPCHRLVLAAASPYFRAMFTGGMAESRQETVELQGLHPDVFEEILSQIYFGTFHVSLDTVQPLYQAADLLQVDYVRETCTSYMAMNVERSTCLDLYKFADAFFVETVKDCCVQCICRYFEEVSSTAEFCSLSVDQLTDIISQDWLDVKEETTVWEAVVRWVEHSREERRCNLPSILPHIRFNLLTSDDMAAILENPLVKENAGTSAVVRNVVQSDTSNLKTRFGMDTEEMVFLFSLCTKEMLFMNPRVGKYISCSYAGNLDFTVNHIFSEVVAMTVTSKNNIYALVRESQRRDLLSLLTYNHLRNVWEHQSTVSMLGGEDSVGYQHLVEVDGHLYYLACCYVPEEDSVTLTQKMVRLCIRKFDHHTDQWQECSKLQLSLQVNRRGIVGVAVSCGSYIYFITDEEMHRYHLRVDQWCKMTTPNNFPSIGSSAVATEKEIYFESIENLGEMYVYDTTSESWHDLPAFQQPEETSHLYDNLSVNGSMYFVLEGQLHLFFSYEDENYDTQAWQVCALDRAAGVWTDLKATIPEGDWYMSFEVCHVAHMYLPCLKASSTDEQNAASP